VCLGPLKCTKSSPPTSPCAGIRTRCLAILGGGSLSTLPLVDKPPANTPLIPWSPGSASCVGSYFVCPPVLCATFSRLGGAFLKIHSQYRIIHPAWAGGQPWPTWPTCWGEGRADGSDPRGGPESNTIIDQQKKGHIPVIFAHTTTGPALYPGIRNVDRKPNGALTGPQTPQRYPIYTPDSLKGQSR